jgi:hypothetical protein
LSRAVSEGDGSLSDAEDTTMEFHCNSIVFAMPEKGDLETKQFSITLPIDAVEMIENGLIPFGLYGKKLATVAPPYPGCAENAGSSRKHSQGGAVG